MKEAIENKFEKIEMRLEKIAMHVKENKKTYLACGGTAVVAVLGTALVIHRAGVVQINSPIQAMNYKSMQVNNTYQLPQVSNLAKPVLDTTTNTPYLSQNRAAKALGASPSEVSKQLNGKIPDVNGHRLEYISSE